MLMPRVRVLLVGGDAKTHLLHGRLSAVQAGALDITRVDCLEKAVKRIGSDPFDVILLDNPVSGRRAPGAVRAIRKADPHTPVIWLSDSGMSPAQPEFPEDLFECLVERRDNPQAICHAIHYSLLRERHEKALLENEARFRIACEASGAMVYDIDRSTGRILFVHGLMALLGRVPDRKLSGMNWWFSQIHKDDLPAVLDAMQKTRTAGTDYTIQYRVQHCNGTYITVEDSGRNLFDPDGRTVRCIGCVVDITRRIADSDALRKSEQRYQALAADLESLVRKRTADLWALNQTLATITGCGKAIVRATSEQALLSDTCRIIVELGGYQLAWIGFVCQDSSGMILPVVREGGEGACLQCVHGNPHEECRGTPAGEAIRTGRASVSFGLRTSPEGQPGCSYCSSIALPLRVEETSLGVLNICSSHSVFNEVQIQALQGLADDLAFGIQALRTRAELDRALQGLEQQSIQLRSLASELTHAEESERKRLAQALHDDLQQLLVASKFCADTLEKEMPTLALKDTAQQLVAFLAEAIESARSLSFELSPPILHNAGLAKALQYLGRRMLAKHGLNVRVHTDEGAEPEAEEIRILLFQSVRELLFNIVKHARVDAAEVDMRRFQTDFVRITVSDSGAGFEADKGGHDAFQNGFGLLSIRGRLDLVGGQLHIESAPGAGSRCILTAPLMRNPGAGQSALKPASLLPPKPGELMRAGRRASKKRVPKLGQG